MSLSPSPRHKRKARGKFGQLPGTSEFESFAASLQHLKVEPYKSEWRHIDGGTKSVMEAEGLANLRKSYVEQKLATRNVSSCFIGLRGNLLPIAARGDISHPVNVMSVELKWVRLVNKCLEKGTYGMRQCLKASFPCLTPLPQKLSMHV